MRHHSYPHKPAGLLGPCTHCQNTPEVRGTLLRKPGPCCGAAGGQWVPPPVKQRPPVALPEVPTRPWPDGAATRRGHTTLLGSSSSLSLAVTGPQRCLTLHRVTSPTETLPCPAVMAARAARCFRSRSRETSPNHAVRTALLPSAPVPPQPRARERCSPCTSQGDTLQTGCHCSKSGGPLRLLFVTVPQPAPTPALAAD